MRASPLEKTFFKSSALNQKVQRSLIYAVGK